MTNHIILKIHAIRHQWLFVWDWSVSCSWKRKGSHATEDVTRLLYPCPLQRETTGWMSRGGESEKRCDTITKRLFCFACMLACSSVQLILRFLATKYFFALPLCGGFLWVFHVVVARFQRGDIFFLPRTRFPQLPLTLTTRKLYHSFGLPR